MSSFTIEPPFWWSGMKNPQLQLLIHSDSIINNAEPTISNHDIKITQVVHFDSPHYLAIYLDLTQILPQTFEININGNIINYEIKQRKPDSKEIEGFDSSDVLYLIMPDRFARHSTEPSSIDDQVALDPVEKMKEKEKEEEERKKKLAALLKEKEAEKKAGKGENKPETKPKFEVPNYPTFIDPITKTERVQYRFNRQDPNARHGGNLAGIIQHLDYIFDLGVTTVWLNPVFDNDMPYGSYHGYATTDFYNVDPRFGSNSDLLELIEKIHQKGNKFVMDMIFNHCGSNHIWYKDPPCEDWFNFLKKGIITNHDITTTFSPYATNVDWEEFNSGSFVHTMPDLNQKNPHLGVYLIQNSIWWIEFAQINGIRLDTYPYCDPPYMNRWVSEVLDEYPNFNIVGEVWIESPLGVAYWQRGNPYSDNNLPTIMDFTLTKMAPIVFGGETSNLSGLTKVQNHLNYDFVYPDVSHLLRFLENHDTDRFLLLECNEKMLMQKFKAGFAFLLTIPGIPQLYYGTEVLMTGIKKRSDGFVRCDFPGGWKNDKKNCFTAEGRTKCQNEAYNFLKTILNWRRGNDVIAKGTMKNFRIQNGIYVYERRLNDKSVIVIINGISIATTLKANRYQEILTDSHKGIDIFTKKEVDLSRDIEINGHDVLILEMTK